MSPLLIKKLLAGGLIAASAAIWVPPLLEDRASGARSSVSVGRNPARVEFPDEEPADDLETDASEAASAAPNGPMDELAEVLRMLRGAGPLDTSPLAPVEPAPDALQSLPIEPGVTQIALDPGLGFEVPGRATPEELSAFFEASPLSGTLVGTSSRSALFGGYLIREGDLLLEGKVRVEEIGTHSVTFDTPLGVRVVTLPPFLVREAGADGLGPDDEDLSEPGVDADDPELSAGSTPAAEDA